MKIQSAIEKVIEDTSWTKARLARFLHKTPQSIQDRLNPNKNKSMNISSAMEMLDPMGYEIVIVPKGLQRLPKGSIRVSNEGSDES